MKIIFDNENEIIQINYIAKFFLYIFLYFCFVITIYKKTQKGSGMKKDVLDLAQKLRKAGLRVQIAYEASKLGKQFQYADKLKIPKVIIMGPDEKKEGICVVKDMGSGEQKEVALGEIVKLFAWYR